MSLKHLNQETSFPLKKNSKTELSETYSVSRITAKRALTELEQLGLVSRTRGKGTFVQELNKNHTKLLKRVLFIIPFEGMSFGDFTQGLVWFL